MRGKWIDNTDYVGPDRRRVSARRLFSERRKFDESSDPPSLPSMIRRLRVQLLGLKTQQDKTHLLQLARAAISQAQSAHRLDCAQLIKEAAGMVHAAPVADPALIQAADTKLIDALNAAT